MAVTPLRFWLFLSQSTARTQNVGKASSPRRRELQRGTLATVKSMGPVLPIFRAHRTFSVLELRQTTRDGQCKRAAVFAQRKQARLLGTLTRVGHVCAPVTAARRIGVAKPTLQPLDLREGGRRMGRRNGEAGGRRAIASVPCCASLAVSQKSRRRSGEGQAWVCGVSDMCVCDVRVAQVVLRRR